MDCIFEISQKLTEEEALKLPPLSLAFIGDSVQSLYERSLVTIGSSDPTGKLHNLVTEKVKAVSQADKVKGLIELMTESEQDLFRRARNAKIHTSAKHAEIGEYRYASGFEAVIGFLYLTGQTKRLKLFLS